MFQTPDGFLWVATLGGLVRFDGAQFQEFSPTKIGRVPNRVVRASYLDRRGRIWLGMDRGVVICVADDPGLVFSQNVGLPDLQIAMMTEDAKGAVWIGYLSGGSRVGRRTR